MGASVPAGQGPGGPWGLLCGAQPTDPLLCIEDFGQPDQSLSRSVASSGEGNKKQLKWVRGARNMLRSPELENLLWSLFCEHDISGNRWFEEGELIKLNEKIAVIHHGKEHVDRNEVRTKYANLFRSKLDPQGRPVSFNVFRVYMLEYLDELDPDPEAQLMILEQFVAEAHAARQCLDAPGAMEDDNLSVECSEYRVSPRLSGTNGHAQKTDASSDLTSVQDLEI
mmetsp:Transcript_37340/g.57982  ORF Transcript_37340/g.57982 Transcript_37340/m.57982 type:complete len:225 (+) Transcript_37340:72-746(+)